MPKHNVCTLEELSDLCVDACITDESCNLIFGSFWGRDTAIQEVLARITLNASEELSLQSVTVVGEGIHLPVYFHKDFLDKQLAKSYPGTLFGSMTNLWLYDKRVLDPDYANQSAYLLLKDEVDHARIWQQIVDLAPFPILDHWRDHVLDIVIKHDMIQTMKTALGSAFCKRITLKADVLQNAISDLIRNGQLAIDPH